MNISLLVDAMAAQQAKEALRVRFGLDGWKLLMPYLNVQFLVPGQTLMREGDNERELYILAEGRLEVQVKGHVIAQVLPGIPVGEGTFFSGQPRSASIVAAERSVAWRLGWHKYEVMSQQYPKLALDLSKALAAVLALRMREALLVGQFA